MRKLCLFLTVILLWAALSGCRGGGLVFKGTHKSQDAALLSKLSEKYPEMEFECTGRTEGAVHTVEAADGTVFPAWTAAKSGGEFQVLDYYLEEWLAGRGYYDTLEERLSELGCACGYGDYNHYDRHLEIALGPADTPEQLQRAAGALSFMKLEFDSLRPDFERETGQNDLMLYFHCSFTLDGEEHFGMFHMAMRESEVWDLDYDFDDYEACLRDCIDKIGKTPDID